MLICTRSLTLPLAVALLLVGGGCSPFSAEEGRGNLREILQENRDKWAEQDIGDYAYAYTRLSRPGEVVVTVRNDTIARVTVGATPAPEGTENEFLTVETFFDLIEAAIDADKENFDAGFDRTLGYPALLLVDYDRSSGGPDELIQVTDFDTLGSEGAGEALTAHQPMPPGR